MIDIKLIRTNPDKIKRACESKQVDVDIDAVVELDKQRRTLIQELESLKQRQNRYTKKIAELKGPEKENMIIKAGYINNDVEKLSKELDSVVIRFDKLMLSVPNPPFDDVKVGKDESENEVVRHWGKVPKFSFKIKDHIQIGKDLDLIDTEQAAKVSGNRFGCLKNEAVLLEFALVRYGFDFLAKQGFVPIVPPVMIKQKPMQAMGYLERGEQEVYKTARDNFYLVGTSEQSIGPMHMNEILLPKELPKRYTAFSTCFRREAGSYGKDVKGIFRVHQFDKIEMFSFIKPEESEEEHKLFLSLEEKLVQQLKIPYQVVKMCTGDLGDPAASKYDIECWIPSQNKYRETHSTSNCTDFQARRLNIKFRSHQSKLEFVHTLNGTAIAIGRMIIAILENYQQRDGSIKIPKVLQKYIGIKKIEKRT